jgi:hypothetical protein
VLQVGSVLDYVGDASANDSLVSLNNVNNNGQKTSAATRFRNLFSAAGIDPNAMPPNGITDVIGTGGLVNLTTEHINWLTSFLATQFEADVITAPEVVTLNGQNVEFVAGAKIPFALGLNTVQGDSTNEQVFYYKHVGAYVSVTPRIVNWGRHGEGRGEAPIQATEVTDWNRLVDWMLDDDEFRLRTVSEDQPLEKKPPTKDELSPFSRGLGVRPLPYKLRQRILIELSNYSPSQLRQKIAFYSERRRAANLDADLGPILIVPSGQSGCDWKPEDCTIDLELVVRLSDGGLARQMITLNRGQETETAVAATQEDDIRAVANVLQVKSGHGVVMAGLIGESDLEDVEKVPVLGDIPFVGYLFRSKATSRTKSETLVFVEAQVLPNPDQARHESARDFALGQPYLGDQLLDNPLEVGMQRVGFGSYLPPHSKDELVFWERTGRKVQKARTHVDDILE